MSTPKPTTRPRPAPRPNRPGPRPRPHGERPGPRPRGAGRRSAAPAPAPARRTRREEPVEREPITFSWRWGFIGALVIALLAVAALLRAPFFAIGEVQISGESRTSEGAIRAALAIDAEQALATYDTDAAELLIAELPWVEAVEVRRGWPSTLRVQIRERVPAAAFAPETGARWVVVSDSGHVLERRMTPPVGVPLVVVPQALVGAAVIGEVLPDSEGVLATSTNLPTQLEPWVESWTMHADGVVAAELVGSATAVFGREPDHRTQFVSLASILDGGTSLVCVERIDLRIPDTPIIDRNVACMTAALELS